MNANKLLKATVIPAPPKAPDATAVYNPSKSGDGPAAKLWELLRRNPAFREDVAWMLQNADEPEAKQKIIRFIRSSVSDQCSITRPIAGYVMRWLWKPLFADPVKILNLMFGPAVSKVIQEDLCLAVFGLGMSKFDDAWQEPVPLNPAQFMNKCPFYLLAPQSFFLPENENYLKRLILPNSLEKDYSGPLKLTGGDFNLDTPWPKTPRVFREHFSWLWANYDSKATNPFTGDRKYLPRSAATGGFGFYGLQEQHDKLYPRLHNELVFVVPACFHTEQSIKAVYKSLKASLEKEFRSLQVSSKKYQFFLGADSQWETFAFVCDRTKYSFHKVREPLFLVRVPAERLGSGNAIETFEKEKKSKGEWGKHSKFKKHIESRYAEMEDLMMSVYPGDSFQAVVNLLHPGWPK